DFRRLDPTLQPSINFFRRDLQLSFLSRRNKHLRNGARSQRDIGVRSNNLKTGFRIVWLDVYRDELSCNFQNLAGVSVVLVKIKACIDGSPHGAHTSLSPCKASATIKCLTAVTHY